MRNIKPEYTKEWFSQQVHLCEKSLYRVTVSLLANQTDAEDAMQEALCTAYEKLHTLKEAEKFRPWLLKIATNAAYDILRRRKRTVPLEDTEPVYHDGTAEKLGLWMAVQSCRRTTGRWWCSTTTRIWTYSPSAESPASLRPR